MLKFSRLAEIEISDPSIHSADDRPTVATSPRRRACSSRRQHVGAEPRPGVIASARLGATTSKQNRCVGVFGHKSQVSQQPSFCSCSVKLYEGRESCVRNIEWQCMMSTRKTASTFLVATVAVSASVHAASALPTLQEGCRDRFLEPFSSGAHTNCHPLPSSQYMHMCTAKACTLT